MPSKTSATKLKARFSFEAIGTYWVIDTPNELSLEQQQSIAEYCERFDQFFSRFREDSAVRQLSVAPGSIQVPAEWLPLIALYDQLYAVTDGGFTACIGDSLEAAGYNATYSLKAGEARPALSWSDLVHLEGQTLSVREPVVLDFGAAGKGFLVDRLAALLQEQGINLATIDASGDIYTWGDQHETVGLEHPSDGSKMLGAVRLQNQALCASATNRRLWAEGRHHIMQAKTGESTVGVVATWVVADTAMVADAVATALFFVEPQVLRVSFPFEHARLHDNGSLDYSAGFKGQLYI